MKHFESFSIFFLGTGLTLLILYGGYCLGKPQTDEVSNVQNASKNGANYDVRPRSVGRVPTGTVVGNHPPVGWSHLVIKSHPTCTCGDVKKVANRDKRLAALFKNVFLLRATENPSRLWSIGEIAFGLTTPVDGQDVVVNPGEEQAAGADLGILGRIILKEIDTRQRLMQVKVSSPHFAVVDVNAAVRHSDANQQMLLRYGLVLKPVDGRLYAFAWLLKPQARQHQLVSDLRLLAPNLVEQCDLHVDKSKYMLGIPSDNAFAAVDIPKAQRSFNPSEKILPAMQSAAPTVAEAAQLDQGLRMLVADWDAAESANPLR